MTDNQIDWSPLAMTHRLTLQTLVLLLPLITFLAAAPPARTATTTPATSQRIYMPLMMNRWPSPPSIFGVEISRGRVGATAGHASAARVSWVRYNGIRWSEVEPSRGERRWQNLASVEAELRSLSSQHLVPMVVVRGTPQWARQRADSECGPIRPEALDAFAQFMHELVKRYSAPPYNVLYWELWNEPDAPPATGSPPYGCWGDPADPYYGGRYFGELLKRVYPWIKQANPGAQVVLGGLLLDCDPQRPPRGKDCRSAHFFEGVILGSGGHAFDILAFHGYPYWDGKRHDWELTHPVWQHRGGVVLGKADFLRGVMQQYGIRKPLIMNEGSLLCWEGPSACQAEFQAAQANYAVRLYTRAAANDLLGAIWFTLNGPGWNQGGLLDHQQQPRAAYNTLKFMAGRLHDATYIGRLEHSATVEGYAFRKGGTTYHIYWTNNGAVAQRTLPPGTRAIYGTDGMARPVSNPVQIGHDPIFIEIGP